MLKKLFSLLALTGIITIHAAAQVNGICEPDTVHPYHRLPTRLQSQLPSGVWEQSVNTAGEYFHFTTTARSFTIKYTLVKKAVGLPAMPLTGTSGVDLYAKDKHGNWQWAPPTRNSFGDTCVYEYSNLFITGGFYLYLPLYASVQWIEVPGTQVKDHEAPIVAYGTSILQGAFASRAGMAWTNMLSRAMDRPVINLGFSGRGRFDPAIFDLMATVPAKLYILDCMPNLYNSKYFPPDTIMKRLQYGIQKLRAAHPDVPILLAAHPAGLIPQDMDTTTTNLYHRASITITDIAKQLKDVYLLTEEDISFDINSITDNTHPNDIGMLKYANAYEKKIREILHETKGNLKTQQPVSQQRDGYNYQQRHEEITGNHTDVILFGNSIIHYWKKGSWDQYMAPKHVQNAGCGNDRIENVLWRIYHGELDAFTGNRIMIMIGTNNLAWNTDEEILKGLDFLIKEIKYRKPQAKIYLGAILPRRAMLERVLILNKSIAKVAAANDCKFFDFSRHFLKGKQLSDELFMPDGLHPNESGYKVLGEAFSGIL